MKKRLSEKIMERVYWLRNRKSNLNKELDKALARDDQELIDYLGKEIDTVNKELLRYGKIY